MRKWDERMRGAFSPRTIPPQSSMARCVHPWSNARLSRSPDRAARTTSWYLTGGQVGFFQSTVRGDFLRAAARDDTAAFDDVGAVGERERKAGHLVDEQDGGGFG